MPFFAVGQTTKKHRPGPINLRTRRGGASFTAVDRTKCQGVIVTTMSPPTPISRGNSRMGRLVSARKFDTCRATNS